MQNPEAAVDYMIRGYTPHGNPVTVIVSIQLPKVETRQQWWKEVRRQLPQYGLYGERVYAISFTLVKNRPVAQLFNATGSQGLDLANYAAIYSAHQQVEGNYLAPPASPLWGQILRLPLKVVSYFK
jgi:hypothetical protein